MIYTRDGLVISPPLQNPSGTGTVTDRNGNFVSWTTASGTTTFTDTLNTTALTVTGTGTPASPLNYGYTSPANTSVSVVVNYKQYTVATNFGAPGISEYTPHSVALVDNVTLPDNTKYIFAYEATPSTPAAGACTPLAGTYATNCVTARIASVTLPAGGQISYAYSGGSNGIFSNDGSTSGFTRTLSSGGNWTYARAIVGSGWPYTKTTVTDPASHVLTASFFGIYETSRSYAGLIGITTCYNNQPILTCNQGFTALPITQRTVITSNGLAKSSVTLYNAQGIPTEVDDYNYGNPVTSGTIGTSGSLARKTLITYATFPPNSLGNTIFNQPSSLIVQDGSGNLKAKTTYAYDENTPLQSSGATHLTSITGSRANLTTVTNYSTSTNTLVQHFKYYDDGNVYQSQDVNSTTWDTTYTYAACGNSFLTQISLPLTLTKSFLWNCNGAVQTSASDENNQPTLTAYADPNFWRPTGITDPLSNVTTLIYASPTQIESKLNFNGGNSTVDVLNTLDTFGRPLYAQKKQSPTSTNYDSIQYAYSFATASQTASQPYVGTAQQAAPGGTPVNTTSYDGAGRVTQITDGGGGTRSYTYSSNDMLLAIGPPATGETTPKQKQIEYDAFDRLTSVCEITTGSGNGACVQNTAKTGYFTKYDYDVAPNINSLKVTQSAQSASPQTRTYIYDMLGRLTSETNPESGTTTYVYDSDATCGTFKGDLVKRTDAVGNVTCYAHDSLHRLTSSTYPSGSYAANTPSRFFVYDSATVNGIVMSNVKGHLAEAYTCATGCPTKLTDLGFSYSLRGETTDVYQATSHIAGYFHSVASYWANGVMNTLAASGPGGTALFPAHTYGVDGEGRPYSVSVTSGQNPVNSTIYNLTSHTTTVSYGSLDSDVFAFDPNTGRMSQYLFNLNGQSITGNVNWNANGTLGSLSINDPVNSTNTQSCTYTYDDLARVSSANCGSKWNQSFSFDPFGNIRKTATVGTSFLPTYNTSTNRISGLSGCTVSYDANGNTLQDCGRGGQDGYAWDSEGRPITIDGLAIVYDALGRGIEVSAVSNPTFYEPVLFSPTGQKLAGLVAFSASSYYLYRGYVPLPGGGAATYGSSGLLFYRHPDWLGSGRLATTSGRTVYLDTAYGPYGESYGATGNQYDVSFTGQTQDEMSALYDFMYRHYSPITGRWMTPDPAGVGAADITDPQTWNRYAYVTNRPLNNIDLFGLRNTQTCCDAGGGGSEFFGTDVGDPNLPMAPPPCVWGCGGSSFTGGFNLSFETTGYGGSSWNEQLPSGVSVTDPNAGLAAAIVKAAVTGDWKALLQMGLDPLEQEMWDEALNPITDMTRKQIAALEKNPPSMPKIPNAIICGSIHDDFIREANETNFKWWSRGWGTIGIGAATAGVGGAAGGAGAAGLTDMGDSTKELNGVKDKFNAIWHSKGCSGMIGDSTLGQIDMSDPTVQH